MSLHAVNPSINATVSASAGSGKTWLLITRITRLLLAGAKPGNILALTFTRKAAGEMQMRLHQRLYEMATVSDTELTALLTQAGCETDVATRQTARKLYETLMHSLYPVRLVTFHSFCQDILARFPLEADIPPGFALQEDTGLLEQQAWQALFVEATQTPDSELSRQLAILMDHCHGAANTRTALNSFISHRSDWWAYNLNQRQPVRFASQQLHTYLQMEQLGNPCDDFFKRIKTENLQLFANLLRQHPTATNLKHARTIDATVLASDDIKQRFDSLKTAFLTKNTEPLKRKDSKTLQTKLGTENAEKFLYLHQYIAEQMLLTVDYLRRQQTFELNHAWYYCGEYLLAIFQRLKRQQRLLDFTDLEWKCFQLINQADNAQWIQYKIDQRIDHILIDEFQDTNPTQWHLLAPILEEIAASGHERWRSVFLVGDEKQSIYSFRRANPELQARASAWLATNLNAQATPLDASRRSSPAIIDCVNHVFTQDEVKPLMPGFSEHKTWLNQLPGKVCLLELFHPDDEAAVTEADKTTATETVPAFRNPLQQPRIDKTTDNHRQEADFIARQIQQLLRQAIAITDDDQQRAIKYGDIMILMRNRLHIDTYEETLHRYGIPFISSKHGGLLENQEVQDLIKLLEILISPFNNLALAQVLKSPIFAASDEDLMVLASQPQQASVSACWYQWLLLLAQQDTTSEPLQRAATLLPHWRKLADVLPVHDCLDRIFSEANLLQRYAAASGEYNRQRVMANCQRLLELSLENDSGRYPGINHFLQYLQNSQQHSHNQLDEPLLENNTSRVRLLTIHASKGLEAPVVFIVDCNSVGNNKSAYSTLVNWPAEKTRPVNFMLQLGKKNTDSITTALQQQKLIEYQREDLNLLYVALTRARQQLYISGVESRKSHSGWYHLLQQGFAEFAQRDMTVNHNCLIYQYNNHQQISPAVMTQAEKPESTKPVDSRLYQPIIMPEKRQMVIAPGKTENNGIDETTQENTEKTNALSRGILIHRALELLSNPTGKTLNTTQIIAQLAAEFHYPITDAMLDQCYREARQTVDNPAFSHIFSPGAGTECYNELPVLYYLDKQHNPQQAVYGIIDRVVKTETQISIIDYKSHRVLENENLIAYAEQFRPQLNYYLRGLQKIWPGIHYKTAILFTFSARLIWL